MDFLGDLLEPHSEALGKIAATITTLQFVSGIFLINDIRKKGSSEAFPAAPFIGAIILTILSLRYGDILGDKTMINVNLFGFAVNVAFMGAFYWYTPNQKKTEIWGQLGIAGIFTAACIAYSLKEDPKLIEFRFGMLITSLLVYLVGAPLLGLGEIIKKQSTEGLPFPLIFAGTLVSFSWLVYGFAIRNNVLVIQNAFLCALSSIQLSLFVIYPNAPSKKSTKKE